MERAACAHTHAAAGAIAFALAPFRVGRTVSRVPRDEAR
jgi:hypothetical protein